MWESGLVRMRRTQEVCLRAQELWFPYRVGWDVRDQWNQQRNKLNVILACPADGLIVPLMVLPWELNTEVWELVAATFWVVAASDAQCGSYSWRFPTENRGKPKPNVFVEVCAMFGLFLL